MCKSFGAIYLVNKPSSWLPLPVMENCLLLAIPHRRALMECLAGSTRRSARWVISSSTRNMGSLMNLPVRNTIDYLRQCQQLRAAGYRVSFTSDPAWLVHQAVNRRAGWPDDPSHHRGSAYPVAGRYPRKAEGDTFNHLCLLARKINTPRLIVRWGELGDWRRLISNRIPSRITED